MFHFVTPVVLVLSLIAPVHASPTVNLDKLAYCVAYHETHNGLLGVGKRLNNAFGIKRGGHFVRYATLAESYRDFKKLWTAHYGGGLPTLAMARRYSGNDRARTWQRNVLACYNRPSTNLTYTF